MNTNIANFTVTGHEISSGRNPNQANIEWGLFVFLAYLPHCVSSWLSGWNTSCWWWTSVGEAGTRRPERWHAHGSPTEQGNGAPGPGCGHGCCCCSGIIISRLDRGGNVVEGSFIQRKVRRDNVCSTSGHWFQNKVGSRKTHGERDQSST